MKADNSFAITGHNRIIKITGIPTEHPGDLTELTIQINYRIEPNDGSSTIYKAIALDHHVIPAIVKALNSAARRSTTR